MYRKITQGWLKHLDFIVLDLICLHVAFVIAYMVRHGFQNPYAHDNYRVIAVVLTLMDLVLVVFFNPMSDVLKRGLRGELKATLIHTGLLAVTVTFYLFSVKDSETYSRIFYYLMLGVYLCLSLLIRLGWKVVLRQRPFQEKTSLFLIVFSQNAEQTVKDIQENTHGIYRLAGIAVLDHDMRGQKICGVPVVACKEDVEEYLKREWVDEVLIASVGIGSLEMVESDKQDIKTVPSSDTVQRGGTGDLYRDLIEMGLVVHISLNGLEQCEGERQTIEHIGDSTVLTYSLGSVTLWQAFVKRALDILGGLAGCIVTGLLCLVIGPMIFFSSPGPIFFSQTRVGRNGKKFKMYKFRSMCLNAEARKAEVAVASGLDGERDLLSAL